MNCTSCDIVYACIGTTFGLFMFFFSGVFLSSRVTGACPVTTNLIIMREQLQQYPPPVFGHLGLQGNAPEELTRACPDRPKIQHF